MGNLLVAALAVVAGVTLADPVVDLELRRGDGVAYVLERLAYGWGGVIVVFAAAWLAAGVARLSLPGPRRRSEGQIEPS